MDTLQTFYDEHPINEQEILSKLAEQGKRADNLEPADLFAFDQDHYGATEATAVLAEKLGVTASSHVLDLCSGMGGTSRFLAHTYGCCVTGMDLTQSRTEGAERLTRMVKLDHLVIALQGDALEMNLPAESFDAVLSQEAFLHIPDKSTLFANCHRVLKPGGRLGFTDWAALDGLTDTQRTHLEATIMATGIASPEDYREHVEAAGFEVEEAVDLSQPWKEILVERLAMFRSLESETVARFGAERHRAYIDAYVFFVDRITSGELGGVRLVARK